MYFCARCCLWELIFWNREIRVPTKVESGFGILKKNRDNLASRIGTVRDSARILGGSGGMSPPKKEWNLWSSKCWKCIEMHWNCQFYHHHVILYHFKYLRSPSGGPFCLLGGGGVCASRTAPCLRACNTLYFTILYYTILYYTILYYTILYYTILYYTVLYCTVLYCTVLYCTVLYYTVLYYTILYYTII